jgi:aerobic-type carbon monoxide dehydrogenase small subunit (CoxS/CutS family)
VSDTIEIIADGKPLRAVRGSTLASALLNAQQRTFRRSTSGESRAPLCGMGICYECRVTVDGVAHQRACMIVVEPGMKVDTEASVR